MIVSTWKRHGTKLLGYAFLVVNSALAVEGLVSKENLKWFVFANLVLGGLTIKRGHTNSKALAPHAGP
jgi:hypothetical protein